MEKLDTAVIGAKLKIGRGFDPEVFDTITQIESIRLFQTDTKRPELTCAFTLPTLKDITVLLTEEQSKSILDQIARLK